MSYAATAPLADILDSEESFVTNRAALSSISFDIQMGLKVLNNLATSSFSPINLKMARSMFRGSHLWTADSTALYLELEFPSSYKPLNMNSFTVYNSSGYSSDSFCHNYPLQFQPRYYIPLGKPDMTTNNIITASFGMQYLVNMQQKAWEVNRKLITYNNINITEESFNRFKALSSRTSFIHNSDRGSTLELIDEEFFIGINYDESKVPRTYSITAAVFYAEFEPTFKRALTLAPKDLYIDWVDSITSGGGLSTKTIPLPKNKFFYEEAYPCLRDRPLKDFIEDYLNSDSAVLLLYGPPGTGKTSLLKQIMQYANESCLITYNKDIAAMDTLFSHFYDCDERFLIVEDADTYMNSRSKDGNDVMKKLLNITDGLTARKDKKVIFTTNLTNLNDVDEALLREGRCYSTLHVDKLNMTDARNLLDIMGHDTIELDSSLKNISLANLYSLVSGRTVDQSVEQISTGFGLGGRR